MACLAALVVAGCGGSDEQPATTEKAKTAPPQAAASRPATPVTAATPMDKYSRPAKLTERDISRLVACTKGMRAAKVAIMPSSADDPAAQEALGWPPKLGQWIEKQPGAKAILGKHGMTGTALAHQFLTVTAGRELAAKARDWPDYQEQAKAVGKKTKAKAAMMRGVLELALQQFEGDEKARKQKEGELAMKRMERMMMLMANYAVHMPRENYDLMVKHKAELAVIE